MLRTLVTLNPNCTWRSPGKFEKKYLYAWVHARNCLISLLVVCNTDLQKSPKLASVGTAMCATKNIGSSANWNRNCLQIDTIIYAIFSLTLSCITLEVWWRECWGLGGVELGAFQVTLGSLDFRLLAHWFELLHWGRHWVLKIHSLPKSRIIGGWQHLCLIGIHPISNFKAPGVSIRSTFAKLKGFLFLLYLLWPILASKHTTSGNNRCYLETLKGIRLRRKLYPRKAEWREERKNLGLWWHHWLADLSVWDLLCLGACLSWFQ